MFQEDSNLSQKLNDLYTINAGDSIQGIAHKTLESSGDWRELADFNGIDIFKPLSVGKSIEIPSLNEVKELALKAIQSQINSDSDLYKDLDLSGIKSPFNTNEWSLISWVLR